MNTGQSMLTIGAFMLLSLLVLRTNNTFLSTNTTVQETKFGILATSLASSIIEEATKKRFDEATIEAIDDSTDLSLVLGFDTGESYISHADDVDDYNGLDTIIADLPSASFRLLCNVSYMAPENPEVNVNYRTWNKKITVTVTSDFSMDTIRISSIYSFYTF